MKRVLAISVLFVWVGAAVVGVVWAIKSPTITSVIVAVPSALALLIAGFLAFLVFFVRGPQDTQEERAARAQRLSGISPPTWEPGKDKNKIEYCPHCLMPMSMHKHGLNGHLNCPDVGS